MHASSVYMFIIRFISRTFCWLLSIVVGSIVSWILGVALLFGVIWGMGQAAKNEKARSIAAVPTATISTVRGL